MREQRVEERWEAKWFAAASALLALCEDVHEDTGAKRVGVDPVIVNPFKWSEGMRVKLYVEGAIDEPSFDLDEHMAKLCDGEVLVKPVVVYGHGGCDYRGLYEHFSRSIVSFMSPLLSRLAERTSADGVEYLVSVIKKGLLLVLEGIRFRVEIPHVPCWCMFHTHPRGHLAPSKKDLESFVTCFIDRALVCGIHDGVGAFCIERRGPFRVDEFEALRLFINTHGKGYRLDELAKALEGLLLEIRVYVPRREG